MSTVIAITTTLLTQIRLKNMNPREAFYKKSKRYSMKKQFKQVHQRMFKTLFTATRIKKSSLMTLHISILVNSTELHALTLME